MSNDGPTITVTRGERTGRSRPKQSAPSARSRSSEWGLPGAGAVVSGLIRGVRTAWLAGLGVVAVVRDAGGQVFDALVEEGKSWEQARRARTAATARQVQRMTDESDAIRAVEERVQEELRERLQHLGVPSRSKVEALEEKVDALGTRIEELSRSVEGTEH